MGIGQAEELRKLITYTDRYVATIEVLKDLAGIERVIVAQKK
jgi:methylase of polypeptide subunit release factors